LMESLGILEICVPQSGYDPKPIRVASTLGKYEINNFNPERVAPVEALRSSWFHGVAELASATEAAQLDLLRYQHSTASAVATRSGLDNLAVNFPGLKQRWALGRNRFAV